MQKFMIVTDMEGMPGVTNWSDVTINTPAHDRFRLQLTTSICEIFKILKKEFGKDTQLVIKDGHWTGNNILYEKIPAGAILVTGKITDQPIVMEQMDETFSGVIFLYFHAPSSTLGNPLAHTESDETYIKFELNGHLSSELELFAYEAEYLKVPVIAVIGDQYTCSEAIRKEITSRTVVTKKGFGGSVESKSNEDISREIKALFHNFNKNDNKYLKMPDHFDLQITYINPVKAYHASYYPGAELIDFNKIRIKSKDYYEIRRAMMFI